MRRYDCNVFLLLLCVLCFECVCVSIVYISIRIQWFAVDCRFSLILVWYAYCLLKHMRLCINLQTHTHTQHNIYDWRKEVIN